MTMRRISTRAPSDIQLGIYDPHVLFRHGFRWHCDHTDHLRVAEEAGPPQPVVEWLATIRVDLVLLDVAHAVPGSAGRASIPAPSCRWIALSDDQHRTTLLRAAHAGAIAILTRDSSPETVNHVIERVARGDRPIAESLAQSAEVVAELFHRNRLNTAIHEPGDLTSRELEVLDCLARGQSTAQIAGELMITTQTVKNHLSSIMSKLEVSDRAMALLAAVRRGWISITPPPPAAKHLAERRTPYLVNLIRRRRTALMRRRP